MRFPGSVAMLFLTLRVLLIGGLLLILPHVTRKGLLFGTYVGEASADRAAARRLRSDWRRGCVILMAVSLLVGWGIALVGAPLVGNLIGTAVLLLGALVLYIPFYTKAKQLRSPGAEQQARRAIAPLVGGEPRGAGLAKAVLGICALAAIATYVYAWLGYRASDEPFVTIMLVPSANLAVSPFLALIALLTAKAKRSVRDGSGGGSLEAQDAFRAANARLIGVSALVICAFATYVSVEIVRKGLDDLDILTLVVLAALVVLSVAVNLIWIVRRYGQGGALMERGTAKTPLTNGLADNAHWVWGLFYVDRDDPSIMVEKRFGIGYTFNYGNRKAVVIVVSFLMLSLGLVTVGLIASLA